MKVAVLADIHANLEALEAVLIATEKERVDRVVCLGDVIGYGPDLPHLHGIPHLIYPLLPGAFLTTVSVGAPVPTDLSYGC